MFANLVRFLGSIRLAVPLLSAIALILIGATVYESQVGSATVQHLIYKSPWFGALMFLLALNLGVSALSRYPWKGARKVGFALTHFGLIVLIAGSAAVIHLSVEGLLLVRTDSPATHLVLLEGELLEVASPGGTPQQTPIWVKSEDAIAPAQFGGLDLLGYREHTLKTVGFSNDASTDNPAIQLQLTSDRMGQSVEQWLALAPKSYQQAILGPAQLELLQAPDNNTLNQLLAPPMQQQGGKFGELTIAVGPRQHRVDVAEGLEQPLPLGDGLQIQVDHFWPDFRLDEHNRPITASQALRNPAVQLQVAQFGNIERWYVFAQPEFEPIHAVIAGEPLDLQIHYQVQPQRPQNYLRVAIAPDHHLFYASQSAQGFQSGPLELGQSIQPGWADFRITLTQVLDHAQIQRQVVPVTHGTEASNPALLVATPDGHQQWVPWGEPMAIADQSGDYFAAFSPQMLELPFTVGLDDFIVERNEGSESVAMWTSKIRIQNPHQGSVAQREVWMNHPTWFQGWKIAQASWNPGDLSQSTLQVKREPLWVTALTWGGALLVVGGIGIMFYGRAGYRFIQRALGSLTPHSSDLVETIEPESNLEAALLYMEDSIAQRSSLPE